MLIRILIETYFALRRIFIIIYALLLNIFSFEILLKFSLLSLLAVQYIKSKLNESSEESWRKIKEDCIFRCIFAYSTDHDRHHVP